MNNLLVVAEESEQTKELRSGLDRSGLVCSFAPYGEGVTDYITARSPDVILLEMNGQPLESWIELCREIKQVKELPVIAMVHRESLPRIDSRSEIDDFVVEPYDLNEIQLRVRRALANSKARNGGVIQCGNLLLDMDRCEVSVAGKPVMLTFREYELLKFLVCNSERVFTRQVLLNKVWGYDYYGGDRTVDVHIRRLRSKIENSGNVFIETVRNIGYRLKTKT